MAVKMRLTRLGDKKSPFYRIVVVDSRKARDVNERENAVDITAGLDESDMGKVIGKQGKIAKALRTLVRCASAKESKRYNVEIKEKAKAE